MGYRRAICSHRALGEEEVNDSLKEVGSLEAGDERVRSALMKSFPEVR